MLQAIAADGVIPILNVFAVTNKKGEPKRALYLTAAIAECGVLLANVDHIAPIITMCVGFFGGFGGFQLGFKRLRGVWEVSIGFQGVEEGLGGVKGLKRVFWKYQGVLETVEKFFNF